ncbi:MAG: alpha/beta fold hydrolase [Halioglobus sp.]|nr:alpha/beta fold hydrolase [Halioglobus sp.]
MMHRAAMTMLLMLALLSACAKEPELPPAAPLQADAAEIANLYAATAGPLDVVKVDDIEFPAALEQRALALNIYYPGEGGRYPVILFSHGNWSDRNSYDRVIEHWVSHGYVVIAPDHLDCCGMAKGIFNSLRYGNLGLIQARVGDLASLLEALPGLADKVPGLAGKIDPGRVALAGHSFGAFSAQQFGGAAALDPESGRYLDALDKRVSAIVALSPPGPMFDEITADSWNGLTIPTLITTGTWDIQPTFWPDWRDHLMSFERAQPGDKYALVVEGADHYLGNLICRTDREQPPQEDALTMVNVVTTAFLDSFLKNNSEARTMLDGDNLAATTGEFARLSRR